MRILGILLPLIVVFLFSAGCSRVQADGKLQVAFTGSIRGNVAPCGCKISKGGVARLANFVNRYHDPDCNWLTVDAGNYVDRAGSRGGCSDKCKFMVGSYEDLHYDYLNIGRAEAQMGYETLVAMRDTVKDSQFLSANLIETKTGKPMFAPYAIKDYGNMKVGVIGFLRAEDFPASVSLIDTTVMQVRPQMDAAKEYLPKLHEQCDVIVMLCDLATDDINSIIAANPGIDLVITSGASTSGENTAEYDGARIVGTGSQGYNGHFATLELNPAWGDSLGYESLQASLTSEYEIPGKWADRLAEFQKDPAASVSPDKKTKKEDNS